MKIDKNQKFNQRKFSGVDAIGAVELGTALRGDLHGVPPVEMDCSETGLGI